jgi:hypothetical protein
MAKQGVAVIAHVLFIISGQPAPPQIFVRTTLNRLGVVVTRHPHVPAHWFLNGCTSKKQILG